MGNLERLLVFILVAQCGFFVFLPQNRVAADADYIDPLDVLNFDPINMRMKENKKSADVQASETNDVGGAPEVSEHCPPCDVPTIPFDETCTNIKMAHDSAIALLKRYVMTLVILFETKVTGWIEPTHLDLRAQVSINDVKRMRSFGEGSSSDIHGLHETLASLVHGATVVKLESGVKQRVLWLEDRIGISLPMVAYITLMMIVFLLVIVTIGRLQLTRRLIWKTVFGAFVISVILNMVEMYQVKVAEQEQVLMDGLKKHCPQDNKISFWQTIYSFFTFEDDKCKEYMKATIVNPVYAVSPIEAIARALVKAIVTPMGLIGEGIKDLFVGLVKDLPVQYQAYMLTCIITCITILIVLVPLLMSGYNFNLFHLIKIGPGEQPIRQQIQYVQPDSHPPYLPSTSSNHPLEYEANSTQYMGESQLYPRGQQSLMRTTSYPEEIIQQENTYLPVVRKIQTQSYIKDTSYQAKINQPPHCITRPPPENMQQRTDTVGINNRSAYVCSVLSDSSQYQNIPRSTAKVRESDISGNISHTMTENIRSRLTDKNEVHPNTSLSQEDIIFGCGDCDIVKPDIEGLRESHTHQVVSDERLTAGFTRDGGGDGSLNYEDNDSDAGVEEIEVEIDGFVFTEKITRDGDSDKDEEQARNKEDEIREKNQDDECCDEAVAMEEDDLTSALETNLDAESSAVTDKLEKLKLKESSGCDNKEEQSYKG